jgi:hypothetical protein
MSEALLAKAERVLHAHNTASFETTSHAFPECIEYVRAVEDEQAWRAAYWTLDAFYAAHTGRHPEIRFYGEARREMAQADLYSRHEGPTRRLERLRQTKPQ